MKTLSIRNSMNKLVVMAAAGMLATALLLPGAVAAAPGPAETDVGAAGDVQVNGGCSVCQGTGSQSEPPLF